MLYVVMLMVVPIGALDLRLSCMSYGQSDLTTVLVADMIFKAIHFNAWNILCSKTMRSLHIFSAFRNL